MRLTKKQKMRGGYPESNSARKIRVNDEEILVRLGFGEGDIDILEEVPLKRIKKEYKKALINRGLSGITLMQIINASELNDLVETNLDKHNISNDVMHNIMGDIEMEPNENNLWEGQGIKKRKSRKTRKTRKTRKRQ